jgi:hypothetical protein
VRPEGRGVIGLARELERWLDTSAAHVLDEAVSSQFTGRYAAPALLLTKPNPQPVRSASSWPVEVRAAVTKIPYATRERESRRSRHPQGGGESGEITASVIATTPQAGVTLLPLSR